MINDKNRKCSGNRCEFYRHGSGLFFCHASPDYLTIVATDQPCAPALQRDLDAALERERSLQQQFCILIAREEDKGKRATEYADEFGYNCFDEKIYQNAE